MAIEILPAQLANQIAAGEVVERPASVVKELVENSLDSGATKIHIDIERGGHKLIRIRDNGSGISEDELTLALSRHATSKLKTLDDLENIISLGFRGEALASISSVSRLTLSSKPKTQETAWQAFAEGRDMSVQVQPTSHPDGTTVEVKDLFFNTPARRKFLRTEKTEFAHIDELVKRIALSRFDVAITLTHNGKVVRQYRSNGSPNANVQRVAQVAGKGFQEQAAFLESGSDGLTLFGWLMPVGTPGSTQYTYVNGRMMRDKLILHAIRQAYEEFIGSGEVPSFVLYLVIDPRQVDVNVHPAKHEVRFHQARLIHDFIVQAIRQVVMDEVQTPVIPNLIAEASNTHSMLQTLPDGAAVEQSDNSYHHGEYQYASVATRQHDFIKPLQHASRQGDRTTRGSSSTGLTKPSTQYNVNQLYQALDSAPDIATSFVPENSFHSACENKAAIQSVLPVVGGLRLWTMDGQLMGSHYKDGLSELWQSQLEADGTLATKSLLLPVRVTLEPAHSATIKLHEATLSSLGFELSLSEHFVILKGTPPCLYQQDFASLMKALVSYLTDRDKTDIVDLLIWKQEMVPERYFHSQGFLADVAEIEKNPQCIARLVEKAVKIDTNVLMTQILEAQ